MSTATATPTPDTASTAAPAATDTSDADVLAIVQAADAGQPAPASSAAPEKKTDTPPAVGESATPAGDDKQDKAEKPNPDAKDGDKSADKSDKKPADTKTDGKPESAYQKAKKDAERLDRSWKALDEEKARVRAREQQVEQQLARVTQLEQEIAQLKAARSAAPTEPPKDEHGISADTYDQLAKQYEDEGDTAMAKLAKSKAEKLRARAPAAPAAPAASAEVWRTPEFQQKWAAEAAAIVKEDPEVGKPDNPIFQRVQQLVNDPQTARFFRADPAGLRAAVQVAKLEQAAARVPELEKQLGERDAEIKRLNSLLSPRGGPPAAPAPGTKSLDDMTDAEREAFVLAAAAAADRGGS